MAAAGAHPGAPPPPPPAAPQPPAATAAPCSFDEEVRESMALLGALFAQLNAAGGGPPPASFFEPCRGRPGVRLDPVTWGELAALVADGSERALGTLGRTPLQIKEYWDYRDSVVLQRFASVTDYLRQKVFGFPTAPGPDGRLVALVPPGFFCSNGEAGCDGGACGCAGGAADASSSGLSSSSGNADAGQQSSSGSGCGSGRQASGGHELVTVWRDNDFPYHLAAGITHFNLWANRPLSEREVQQHIARHVPPGADTLWFVNPPSLQSVPAIWHAHIFARQAVAAGQEGQAQQASERQAQQAGERQEQRRPGAEAVASAAGAGDLL